MWCGMLLCVKKGGSRVDCRGLGLLEFGGNNLHVSVKKRIGRIGSLGGRGRGGARNVGSLPKKGRMLGAS